MHMCIRVYIYIYICKDPAAILNLTLLSLMFTVSAVLDVTGSVPKGPKYSIKRCSGFLHEESQLYCVWQKPCIWVVGPLEAISGFCEGFARMARPHD